MKFRTLTETEKTEFRRWARENYKINSLIDLLWHPVIVEECEKMNSENIGN